MTLGFFSAITYKRDTCFLEKVTEKIDDYFYLGGKKAHVLQGLSKKGNERVVFDDVQISSLEKTAKIISYFTLIIPIICLTIKASLRFNHTFKVIDPKKKLEKGIHILETTLQKIEKMLPCILRKEDIPEIEWLGKDNNLVFRLKSAPHLVCKLSPINNQYYTEKRFENMMKAKAICLIYGLKHLFIPHAKKLEIHDYEKKKYTLIVEENVPLASENMQDASTLYKNKEALNEPVRELAIFIARTNFSDVIDRNIPLIKTPPLDKKRIALIDIEDMDSAHFGLFGSDEKPFHGLVRCVCSSEDQINTVIREARKHGIPITESQAEKEKKARLLKIQKEQALMAFYEKRHIETGKELLLIEEASLGIDLNEEIELQNGKKITLRAAFHEVLRILNQQIQDDSFKLPSIKSKRSLELDRDRLSFGEATTKNKILLIRFILETLVSKGYLFGFATDEERYGIVNIQA